MSGAPLDGASVVPSTGSPDAAGAARGPLWLVLTVSIVFGLFFAYDVWEAVGNLVGLLSLAAQLDTTLNGVGWAVLLVAILLPVVLFVIAFLLGRSRPVLQLCALYLVGLGVSAVLAFDALALVGPGTVLV